MVLCLGTHRGITMKKLLSVFLILFILLNSMYVTTFYASGNTDTMPSSGEPTTITHIDAYHRISLAVTNDGKVAAWGDNRDDTSLLGFEDTHNLRYLPQFVPALSGVKQLSIGYSHSLALMENGTVKAWGENFNGELGFFNSRLPTSTPTTVEHLDNVIQVSAGKFYSLALLNDGTVKAFGSNTNAQLGLADIVESHSPVIIPGLYGVKQICAEDTYAAAVLHNGAIKIWGSFADSGNLISEPKTIEGLDKDIVKIATTKYTIYALMSDNTVKVWGINPGNLDLKDGNFSGFNQPYTIDTPATIPGLTGVKDISVSSKHGLALMQDGSVNAWGYNNTGALGFNDTSNRSEPETIPFLSDVAQVAAGYNYSMALMKDGKVKVWGENLCGQLGLGDFIQRNTPTDVTIILPLPSPTPTVTLSPVATPTPTVTLSPLATPTPPDYHETPTPTITIVPGSSPSPPPSITPGPLATPTSGVSLTPTSIGVPPTTPSICPVVSPSLTPSPVPTFIPSPKPTYNPIVSYGGNTISQNDDIDFTSPLVTIPEINITDIEVIPDPETKTLKISGTIRPSALRNISIRIVFPRVVSQKDYIGDERYTTSDANGRFNYEYTLTEEISGEYTVRIEVSGMSIQALSKVQFNLPVPSITPTATVTTTPAITPTTTTIRSTTTPISTPTLSPTKSPTKTPTVLFTPTPAASSNPGNVVIVPPIALPPQASPSTIPSSTPAPTLVAQPTAKIPSFSGFRDTNHWSKDYMKQLLEKGILTGYDDRTLRPENEITRAESIGLIAKAAGLKPITALKFNFSDKKDIPPWAMGYIQAATEKGIVTGYPDLTYKPNNKITRAELIAMICKAFQLENRPSPSTEFNSKEDMPQWSRKYVLKAYNLGIIKGYQDKTLKVNRNISRAEAFVILTNCLRLDVKAQS